MRYRPLLSDRTMTVIFVFAFRACTKAARNGAPSGPVTVPVTVAAYVTEARIKTVLTRIRVIFSLNECMRPPSSLLLRRVHAGTETENQVSRLQRRKGYQTGALAVYGDSPSGN